MLQGLQASVRASGSSSSKLQNENYGNFTRTGSMRKVLPADPSKNLKLGYHNEEALSIYKLFHQEYIILAEFKMLHSENLKGIYVIPSRESSLTWFGIIFVRSGLYHEGVFRFNIILPDNFPDCEHPKVIFTSKMFHPVIDEHSGELNLNGGFPEWKKGEQHVWQILKYINWIFDHVQSSLEHAVHQDAVNLYRTDEETFKTRVRSCVKESIDHLYDPSPTTDKHYISFTHFQPEIHDPILHSIYNPKGDEKVQAAGSSWVAGGTFKPLTRPPTPESDS